MSSMNPMTNRWAAAFMVGAVLLAVVELVGTDDDGGVLSRAAGADGEVVGGEAPTAEAIVVPADQTPEEDLPQIIEDDSPDIVDASEQIEGEGGEEPQDVDDSAVGDEFVEDDSGE